MKVINVSSGADGVQLHHENVISTAFIFLLLAPGGSSEAVSSGKIYIHCIYFSLTAMGKIRGSRGLSSVLGASPRAYRGAVLLGKSNVHGIHFYLNTGGIK